jgi:predicted nucleotidyltransferase
VATDIKAVKQHVENYARDVCEVFPVDKVVLFGSYAKGLATEQSDIDVCFFLSSFENKRRVDIIKELLRLMRKYKGVYFEPTVFPTDEIQNDNPFVKEILRTGVELAL